MQNLHENRGEDECGEETGPEDENTMQKKTIVWRRTRNTEM